MTIAISPDSLAGHKGDTMQAVAEPTAQSLPDIETILTTFDTNYAWNYGSVPPEID